MSFQWTVIASFLYCEVGVVILLLLPFISAQRWQKLLRSRFLRNIGQQVHIYYYIALAILILCLLDSIRDVRRYSHEEEGKVGVSVGFDNELKSHMKLFRAQRNFYITGFSLFLMFVIRRLVNLIMIQATLQATSAAAMNQAQSATRAAEALLDQQRSEDENGKERRQIENESNEAHTKEIGELKSQLENVRKELSRAQKEVEAMKSQSESLSREYDRVSGECQSLQRQLANSTDKKSD